MWFDSWSDLVRILVVAPVAYLALLAVLRLTGKRTLSKLNAFDLVVTVALGSTLASIILSSDVSISEGILALSLLVAFQYAVTWCSVRSDTVKGFAKAEPTLLYRDGFLDGAMRRQRVTREEVHQVARSQGRATLDDVGAVVLETDGSLSILSVVPPEHQLAQDQPADRA